MTSGWPSFCNSRVARRSRECEPDANSDQDEGGRDATRSFDRRGPVRRSGWTDLPLRETSAGRARGSTDGDRPSSRPSPSGGGGRLELLDAAGHDLREAPSPRSAPVEPPDELAVHEHGIALRDALDRASADRRMPRGDRQGKETLARLRNREAELGDVVARR